MLLSGSTERVDASVHAEGANMKARLERVREESGAMGYILLWALGVPASVLFLIFLMRGCT